AHCNASVANVRCLPFALFRRAAGVSRLVSRSYNECSPPDIDAPMAHGMHRSTISSHSQPRPFGLAPQDASLLLRRERVALSAGLADHPRRQIDFDSEYFLLSFEALLLQTPDRRSPAEA